MMGTSARQQPERQPAPIIPGQPWAQPLVRLHDEELVLRENLREPVRGLDGGPVVAHEVLGGLAVRPCRQTPLGTT